VKYYQTDAPCANQTKSATLRSSPAHPQPSGPVTSANAATSVLDQDTCHHEARCVACNTGAEFATQGEARRWAFRHGAKVHNMLAEPPLFGEPCPRCSGGQ